VWQGRKTTSRFEDSEENRSGADLLGVLELAPRKLGLQGFLSRGALKRLNQAIPDPQWVRSSVIVEAERVQRRCVFCDGAADSNEHVFPEWLNGLIPESYRLVSYRDSRRRQWDTRGFDHKVGQVCKTCNNGWMSGIEVRSKPLISELALDVRTVPLSHDEQAELSTWLYKTAIMLALLYPATDRYVPEVQYRDFRDHHRPPHGITIWIAAVAPTSERVSHIGWGKPERLDLRITQSGQTIERQGYRISFSVFALICQMMWDPFGAGFAKPRAYRDAWTRIRPMSKGAWPPVRRFPEADLEDLAGGPIHAGPEPPGRT
jgi:hypothetical protein